MAIPECAICLDNIGLGDGRATLRGCYHQFCANCILEAVLFYKRIKCPVCKNEIGAVHWARAQAQAGLGPGQLARERQVHRLGGQGKPAQSTLLQNGMSKGGWPEPGPGPGCLGQS